MGNAGPTTRKSLVRAGRAKERGSVSQFLVWSTRERRMLLLRRKVQQTVVPSLGVRVSVGQRNSLASALVLMSHGILIICCQGQGQGRDCAGRQ